VIRAHFFSTKTKEMDSLRSTTVGPVEKHNHRPAIVVVWVKPKPANSSAARTAGKPVLRAESNQQDRTTVSGLSDLALIGTRTPFGDRRCRQRLRRAQRRPRRGFGRPVATRSSPFRPTMSALSQGLRFPVLVSHSKTSQVTVFSKQTWKQFARKVFPGSHQSPGPVDSSPF